MNHIMRKTVFEISDLLTLKSTCKATKTSNNLDILSVYCYYSMRAVNNNATEQIASSDPEGVGGRGSGLPLENHIFQKKKQDGSSAYFYVNTVKPV